MKLQSKFPSLGTTIFSKISTMANQYNALNLGQGFPDFSPSPYLLEKAHAHTQAGANQYAPMSGAAPLRCAIQSLHRDFYQAEINADQEITVTSGATEAIFCAISAVVHPGDEVIVFDPSYDSYIPNIELNGGVPVRINLNEDFEIPWGKVKESISAKTRCIIINSPHNPSGALLKTEELDLLWDMVKDTNIVIISDEVYQHIIFDNKTHVSPFNDERFRDRTFAISSFGKTFHVTGWKVGYCVAAPNLTQEFRKVHQYITYCTPANLQLAIADMLDNKRDEVRGLSAFYQQKRDLFQDLIKDSKFKILPCSGSYFQLVDYSELDDCDDLEFCEKLIKEHGLAAIPISVFYNTPPAQKVIRFCFAKEDETLLQAKEKLAKL